MSILEIEKRIIEEAEAEASRIKAEAEARIREHNQLHARKLEEVRSEITREAERRAEEARRSHLVPARLKARRDVLEEKQTILSKIYAEIKKAKKLSPAEAKKLREETEVKAANILFGPSTSSG
jgi:vacuolar-type H+-ATPase subunit E/Vma4